MIVIRLVIAAAGSAAAALVLVFLGAPVPAAAVGAITVGVLAFLALRPHPAAVAPDRRAGTDRRSGVDRRRPDPSPYEGPERREGERRKGSRREAERKVRHSEAALLAEQAELEEGRAARRARRAGDRDLDD